MLGKGIFHDLLLNNIGFTNKDLHTETSCSSYRATVIENARFLTLQLNHHDGRTNGRMDGQSLL